MFFSTSERRVFSILLIFICWVGAHPYFGIIHDGRLYLAQALLSIDPEIYGQDIFFKYGSQDRFTVFPYFYAWVINWMGISRAAFWLTIISQVFFLLGLWLLLKTIFGKPIAFWCLCVVTLFSHFYGGFRVISYSEMFFTARSMAEPMCLLFLWAMLVGRFSLMVVLAVLAFALHPLTTLPCVFLAWIYLLSKQKKIAWFAVLIPLFILFAFLGVSPFDGFFRTYDTDWWDIVRTRNRFVIPLQWDVADWMLLLTDCTLLLFARHLLDMQAKSFITFVLMACAILLPISILATSGFQNVLLTSLQLWRVHWIVHLLSVATIPFIIFRLWSMGKNSRLACAYLVIGLYFYPEMISLLLVVVAVTMYVWHRRGHEFSSSEQKLLKIGIQALMLFLLIDLILKIIFIVLGKYYALMDVSPWGKLKELLFLPLFLLMVISFMAVSVLLNWRRTGLALGITVLVGLVVFWDQRDPPQRYLEESSALQKPFDGDLKSGAEIYWHNDVLFPWMSLRKASYFTNIQGAGVLFNRGTAMEFLKRSRLLGVDADECGNGLGMSIEKSCIPTIDAMRAACKASPALDGFVLPIKMGNVEPNKNWRIHFSTEKSTFYHYYHCQSLLKVSI